MPAFKLYETVLYHSGKRRLSAGIVAKHSASSYDVHVPSMKKTMRNVAPAKMTKTDRSYVNVDEAIKEAKRKNKTTRKTTPKKKTTKKKTAPRAPKMTTDRRTKQYGYERRAGYAQGKFKCPSKNETECRKAPGCHWQYGGRKITKGKKKGQKTPDRCVADRWVSTNPIIDVPRKATARAPGTARVPGKTSAATDACGKISKERCQNHAVCYWDKDHCDVRPEFADKFD